MKNGMPKLLKNWKLFVVKKIKPDFFGLKKFEKAKKGKNKIFKV